MSVINLKILDIIRFKRDGGTIATENKSCYVISCRLSGKSSFLYNGEKYEVGRGDVLFIPGGASYRQWGEKEEIICFHLEMYGKTEEKLKIYRAENTDDICRLFENAAERWRDKTDNYEYSCMADLYRIISLTGAGIAGEKVDDDIIGPAIRYMETNMFNEDLSVNKMAESAHISQTYLSLVFRKKFGCTMRTYINKSRIEKAKMMLESGCYTNEETASLCGFSNVKYFYVVFKKVAGMTTKEYLNKINGSGA